MAEGPQPQQPQQRVTPPPGTTVGEAAARLGLPVDDLLVRPAPGPGLRSPRSWRPRSLRHVAVVAVASRHAVVTSRRRRRCRPRSPPRALRPPRSRRPRRSGVGRVVSRVELVRCELLLQLLRRGFEAARPALVQIPPQKRGLKPVIGVVHGA